MGVAIGVFRHENIIADQQGRHHAAGRDEKRLEQEGADDHRDQRRIEYRLDIIDQGRGRLLTLCHVRPKIHPGCQQARIKPAACGLSRNGCTEAPNRMDSRIRPLMIKHPAVSAFCVALALSLPVSAQAAKLVRPTDKDSATAAASSIVRQQVMSADGLISVANPATESASIPL